VIAYLHVVDYMTCVDDYHQK